MQGCMPLHVAAYEGPLDVLQALMSHGAVTHATNQLVGHNGLCSGSSCVEF